MPDSIVSKTTLTLQEDRYIVELAGNSDSGSCVVRQCDSVFEMEIKGQSGPNAGKTFLAIAKFLNAEQIKIAYDLSGSAMPTSFTPTSSPTSYVATFDKAK